MNGENYITQMPADKDKYLKFKNFMNMNTNPYKVYADFEAILVDRNDKDVEEKNTKHVKQHVPISYCLYLKTYDSNVDEMITYKGADCVDHFYKNLSRIQEKVLDDIAS